MFRFADLGQVIWPVTIGDAEFRVAFKIYTRKELRARKQRGTQALVDKINADGTPKTTEDLIKVLEHVAEKEDQDEAELLERVKDWFDVEDGEGKPLGFTVERLQAVLAMEYGFKAFNAALLEASQAGPAKNSQPGPGGAPARDQA